MSNEVDAYLDEPCLDRNDKDILNYWKLIQQKFPHMAQLACQYLALPVTSAPVERLFSVAGKNFKPDLYRLKSTLFEKLMLIKCNSVFNILFVQSSGIMK